MMFLLPTFFLAIFSLFNLFGIKKELFFPQLLYYGIGLGFFFLGKRIGLQFFRNNAKTFYWVFIVLFLLLFVIGVQVKGSTRWIDLYFFNFQPSEFFKVFFVVFLADFFSRNRKKLENFSTFLLSIVYFLIPTFLVFKQPDFANALTFVFIYFVMLLFSSTPKKYILYLFGMSVLLAPLTWFVLQGYQKERILSFLNPHIDQGGASYNMIQAMITIGSGKFFGRGLGSSTQSRLFFLPENHTDFAFASLVEQFGFLGGFVVILLFLTIAILLLKKLSKQYTSQSENDIFRFLFTLGIFSYFIFQIFVNIGMNLGLLPIAGVALPIISYGGSSLVSFIFAWGLIP